VHFDNLYVSSISDVQAKKFENPKYYDYERPLPPPKKKNKQQKKPQNAVKCVTLTDFLNYSNICKLVMGTCTKEDCKL
jgi:hypothetical protein